MHQRHLLELNSVQSCNLYPRLYQIPGYFSKKPTSYLESLPKPPEIVKSQRGELSFCIGCNLNAGVYSPPGYHELFST